MYLAYIKTFPSKNEFSNMKFGSRISSLQLAKVAAIITILVIFPRVIALLEPEENVGGYFTGTTFSALLLRALLFFGFSFLVLQLNTNLRFDFPFRERWKTLFVVILINLGLALTFAKLFSVLYTLWIKNETLNNELRFIWAIFLALTLILYVISDIINLQRFRQEKVIENEKLLQQNLEKELSALKNQVNPHFLFNSLNSLLGIVSKNKEASQYVKQLSFLYRYILQSGEKDLVLLKDELKFLESYIYLIKTRYRERFNCSIDLPDSILDKKIPPLALQILVENAVKHNEISEEYPLNVAIGFDDGYLTVQNPIRKRNNLSESNHVGLANLNTRFELLLGKGIRIDTENTIFKVELPIH